ncbi:hypothetical protein NDU88_004721 [Pleurodeles waltl]|uniref:Uncharacterized protein n=1 Tax=Pleurodeles waltl TaxID=8319 RepID=A0AAV7SJR9_PLEWA|nr:hypothetical protein NDU88_004721 [Pleurodeles waltl]
MGARTQGDPGLSRSIPPRLHCTAAAIHRPHPAAARLLSVLQQPALEALIRPQTSTAVPSNVVPLQPEIPALGLFQRVSATRRPAFCSCLGDGG